jgi:hypothetical protein
MRWAVVLATAVLALGLTVGAKSTARAESIVAADVRRDGGDAVITLTTTGALGEPRIRVGPGRVRLWFPGADRDTFLDAHGDGTALRRVTVRPGSSGTSVVELALARGTRVPSRDDVRVAVEGERTVVRVAYRALGVTLPAAEPSAASAPPPPRGAGGEMDGARATVPPAAPPTPTVAAPDRREQAAGGRETVDAPAANAAPLTGWARGAPNASPSTGGAFPGAIATGSGPGPGTLLGVALLLGAALLGARWMQRQRRGVAARPIEVVASHRLGTKHQLVVVRAFDREILLSVQGSETRRIAARRLDGAARGRRVESGTNDVREPASSATGAGSACSNRAGDRLGVSAEAAVPDEPTPPSREPRAAASLGARGHGAFGRELARAISGETPDRAATDVGPALRLVGDAALPAASKKAGPLAGIAPRAAATRGAVAEDEGTQAAVLARAPVASIDAGAESVSGLLRLRHAERG